MRNPAEATKNQAVGVVVTVMVIAITAGVALYHPG